jgi:hypothetical protein
VMYFEWLMHNKISLIMLTACICHYFLNVFSSFLLVSSVNIKICKWYASFRADNAEHFGNVIKRGIAKRGCS